MVSSGSKWFGWATSSP